MISHYPIVLEHESNGSVSAYVVGLPGVFAAADSERAAGKAIRVALCAHLTALQALPCSARRVRASLRVARISHGRRAAPEVAFVGLGALLGYWKQRQVDLRAGILCALGMLVGGYLGGLIAVPLASRQLKGLFGCFLMLAALLLWRKPQPRNGSTTAVGEEPANG